MFLLCNTSQNADELVHLTPFFLMQARLPFPFLRAGQNDLEYLTFLLCFVWMSNFAGISLWSRPVDAWLHCGISDAWCSSHRAYRMNNCSWTRLEWTPWLCPAQSRKPTRPSSAKSSEFRNAVLRESCALRKQKGHMLQQIDSPLQRISERKSTDSFFCGINKLLFPFTSRLVSNIAVCDRPVYKWSYCHPESRTQHAPDLC